MNRIEEELAGTARVIRLSVQSEPGRQAALTYGVRAVPTLIILDECGEIAGRSVGIPDANEVISLVRGLPVCEG